MASISDFPCGEFKPTSHNGVKPVHTFEASLPPKDLPSAGSIHCSWSRGTVITPESVQNQSCVLSLQGPQLGVDVSSTGSGDVRAQQGV